jgi:hypothetical protein
VDEVFTRDRRCGGRIAELEKAQARRRDRAQFGERSVRSMKVQCVDCDAECGVINRGDGAPRRREIVERHPRHELDVDGEAARVRELGKACETRGPARLVRIIAVGMNMTHAHRGGDVEHRGEGFDIGVGQQTTGTCVERGQAMRTQSIARRAL